MNLGLLGQTVAAVLLFMTLAFAWAQLRGRYDTADIVWGPGFIVAAVVSLQLGCWPNSRGLLVSALVSVWGLRLASHIWLRHVGRPEDRRYIEMRARWGAWTAWRAWVQIFLAQGLLLLVISLPIIVINTTISRPLTWFDGVGVVVWLGGFMWETVGDYQLTRFLGDPAHKGQLMTRGLWRYSRHPNYFGEITQWWGLWLIACSVSYGVWTIVGPLTITLLITKVSGIPLLERAYAGRPDWAAYRAQTSRLIPWWPRRP